MRRSRRTSLIGLTTIAMVAFLAAPALAAPPPRDGDRIESEADHDNGYGNDDRCVAVDGDVQNIKKNGKPESAADHDNGIGNDRCEAPSDEAADDPSEPSPTETDPADEETGSPVDADTPVDADVDQPDTSTPATDTDEADVDPDETAAEQLDPTADVPAGEPADQPAENTGPATTDTETTDAPETTGQDDEAAPADSESTVGEQPDATPAESVPADEGRLESTSPAPPGGAPADDAAPGVEEAPGPETSAPSASRANVIEGPADESPAAVSEETPDVAAIAVPAGDTPAASQAADATRGKAPKDHPVDHDSAADHDHGIGNDTKKPAADEPIDGEAGDTTDPAPVQPVVDTTPTGPTGDVPSAGQAATPGQAVQPPAIPDSPAQGPATGLTPAQPLAEVTVEPSATSNESATTGTELALADLAAADFGVDTPQTIVAEVRRLITSPFAPALPGGGALAHLAPLAAGELVSPAPRHTVPAGADPRSAALAAAADAAEAMAVPAALGALTLLGWAVKPGAVKLVALLRSLIG